MPSDFLVKIQVPKEYTYNFIAKIYSLSNLSQTVVDPQNPKEQARIQSLIDNLEDKRAKLIDLCTILSVPLEEVTKSKDLESIYDYLTNPDKLAIELDAFLEKNEMDIRSKSVDYNRLKKEKRALSALLSFQDETENTEFSVDLISSTRETTTFLGEIPASYEELVRFYLYEITSGDIFFWASKESKEGKKVVFCITLDRYQSQVEEILKQNFFDETVLSVDFVETIMNRNKLSSIKELEQQVSKEIKQISLLLKDYSSKFKSLLEKYVLAIHRTLSILGIEEKGRTSEKEYTYWGWIKENKYESLISEIETLQCSYKIKKLEEVPFKRKKTILKPEVFSYKSEAKRIEKKEVPTLSKRGTHAKGYFMFPEKTSFIRFEAPLGKEREFISFIYSLNSVQPVKMGPIPPERLEEITAKKQKLVEYQSRVQNIKELLGFIDAPKEEKKEIMLVNDYKHIKAFIENFLRDYEESIVSVTSRLDELKLEKEQLALYRPFEAEFQKGGITDTLLEKGSYTTFHLGSIPKNHFKAVKFFLSEVTDDKVIFWTSDHENQKRNEKSILVLSLQEYDSAISRVLNEYSFTPLNVDLDLFKEEKSFQEIQSEIQKEIDELELKKKELIDKIQRKLIAVEELISYEIERTQTMELVYIYENKLILWGWIPSKKVDQLTEDIAKIDSGLSYTIVENVPLVHPSVTKKGKLLGSMRGLVGSMGEPNPHEVDPYFLIKFTFPIIFGMMFADVGHGILLALFGFFLTYRKRKKKIKTDESITGLIYAGSEILMVCGLSAAFFGFLFGSILGDEEFIPEIMHKIGVEWIPLINPLHETKLFLVVSIIIGFIMIQIGIWLKIYSNLRYGHHFTSWASPLTLSLVYVGIFAVLYNIIAQKIKSHTFPSIELNGLPAVVMKYVLISLAILVPLLFVLEYLHAKSDGIMDTIDHIIALVSNTLSFSRIMALLLVHSILSGLPFIMTGVEAPLSTGWYWWVVGLIVAIFIILPIEGLLSFLNTLRLHWVEWFTKFYVGDGEKYEPLVEKRLTVNLVPASGS